MTIREYATDKGISTQAIYKRLQDAGLSAKQATEPKTKNLTPDAIKLLDNHFTTVDNVANDVANVDNELQNKLQTAENKIADLMTQLDQLKTALHAAEQERDAQRQANEVLAVKLGAAEKETQWTMQQVKSIEGERDYLREQLARAITPKLQEPEQRQSITKSIGAWISSHLPQPKQELTRIQDKQPEQQPVEVQPQAKQQQRQQQRKRKGNDKRRKGI